MDLSGFPNLLDRAFLEFRIKQTRQRLSVSLNSFASYLDFSPPIVNTWLSGNRLPSPGNVERMIPKLVELLDVEVYDVLGLPRPDFTLQRLTEAWPRIPLEYRQKLVELGEMYATGKDFAAKEIYIQNQDTIPNEDSIKDQDTISKEVSIQDQDTNPNEDSIKDQDTIQNEDESSIDRGKGQQELF